MKVSCLIVVLCLQCSNLLADDRDFFLELDSQTRALDAHYQEEAFKTLLARIYDWLVLQPNLSPSQQAGLRRTFFTLKQVLAIHDSADRKTIHRALLILRRDQAEANGLNSIRTNLEQLLKTRLFNTWLGDRPKEIQELSRSYLNLSESLKLQTLSKGSQEETAIRILKEFPDSILPFSETPSSRLSALPGYSITAQFKETAVPLEAMRLAVRFIFSEQSESDRSRLASKFARMASSLSPTTSGYQLIKNLREVFLYEKDFLSKAVTAPYELLADAGHPYAIEIHCLILVYEGTIHEEGYHPSIEKYLAKQSPTLGLTYQEKGALRKLPPTAKELSGFWKDKEVKDQVFDDLKSEHLSEREVLQKKVQTMGLFEKIAKNQWATLTDKKDALKWASETKNLKKVSYLADLVAQDPQATLTDKRQAISVAAHNKEFTLASKWAEWVARDPESTLQDKRSAYARAREHKDRNLMFYWSNLIAQDTQSTLSDKRLATRLASLQKHNAIASQWALRAAQDPQATPLDKSFFLATSLSAKDRTAYWMELAALDPRADIQVWRTAAHFFVAIKKHEKALHWLRVISECSEATESDRSAYTSYLERHHGSEGAT